MRKHRDSITSILLYGVGVSVVNNDPLAIQGGLSERLVWAAEDGNIDEINLLVAAGGDIHMMNDGLIAITCKTKEDHTALIAHLVNHYKLDVNAHQGKPLINAASWSSSANLQMLLLLGAKPSDEAIIAAAHDGDLDNFNRLELAGANIHASDTGGDEAALIEAAKNGHAKIIERLLFKGSDVNARGVQGPLYWAAACGHANAVHVLIKHGADLKQYGLAAMLFAVQYQKYDVVKQVDDAFAKQGLIKPSQNADLTTQQKDRISYALNNVSSDAGVQVIDLASSMFPTTAAVVTTSDRNDFAADSPVFNG